MNADGTRNEQIKCANDKQFFTKYYLEMKMHRTTELETVRIELHTKSITHQVKLAKARSQNRI